MLKNEKKNSRHKRFVKFLILVKLKMAHIAGKGSLSPAPILKSPEPLLVLGTPHAPTPWLTDQSGLPTFTLGIGEMMGVKTIFKN